LHVSKVSEVSLYLYVKTETFDSTRSIRYWLETWSGKRWSRIISSIVICFHYEESGMNMKSSSIARELTWCLILSRIRKHANDVNANIDACIYSNMSLKYATRSNITIKWKSFKILAYVRYLLHFSHRYGRFGHKLSMPICFNTWTTDMLLL